MDILAYKVVAVKNGRRISPQWHSLRKELILTYYPSGKVVVPKIGRLFVFSLLSSAEEFYIDQCSGHKAPYELWQVFAEDAKSEERVSDLLAMNAAYRGNLEEFRDYWQRWTDKLLRQDEGLSAYHGTYSCASLRLLKKIK